MLDFNPGEHICVVGDARPEKTNPIYLAHEKVILILVVERATGLIVDADTNMVCELTRRFLRSVFVGHSLVDDLRAYAERRYGDDWREMTEKYRYHAQPFTKESLLYREIFERYYPGQAELVAGFWMPNRSWKGCDVDDPSARVLSNYGASGL